MTSKDAQSTFSSSAARVTDLSLVRELVLTLQELCEQYEHLLHVVVSEKNHLLSAQIPSLTENNHSKEALLFKIRSLDKSREIQAFNLSCHLQGSALDNMHDVRLLPLADQLAATSPESGQKLRSLHQQLSVLIEKITAMNKENKVYAQSALGFLNGAMNNIKQSVTAKPTYGKRGKMFGSQEAHSGNFVSREV